MATLNFIQTIKSEFKMSAPAVFFIAAFKCAAALTQKFDVLLQYCFQWMQVLFVFNLLIIETNRPPKKFCQ